MKILFLEQYSTISGGQLCLLELIEKLDTNLYTPVVIVPEAGQLSERLQQLGMEYRILPIGTYSTGKKSWKDIFNYICRSLYLVPRVAGIIKSEGISLVYANAPRTFLWGTIAARIAGVPLIWHVHSMLGGRVEKALTNWLLSWQPTKIIVVSKAVARSFLGDKWLPNLEVVYNGADLQKFSPKVDGDQIRREFGIDAEAPVAGIVGQVSEWKGHETFIRAAGIVARELPQARFLIVGAALYDGIRGEEFITRLQGLIKDLQLEGKVIFTGPRQDIPQVMKAMDMIVSASREPDPCPRVIMEGLATGRPVIATAHGGAPEIIEAGKDGLLFPPDDAKALAACIKKLMRDKNLAQAYGQQARAKAEKRFNIDNYARQLTDIVNEVLIPRDKGGN